MLEMTVIQSFLKFPGPDISCGGAKPVACRSIYEISGLRLIAGKLQQSKGGKIKSYGVFKV
jgi:hypothetical protein